MIYNQEELEKDVVANMGRPYQQCSMSVMDTISDPNITFDEKGICSYYKQYLADEKKYVLTGETGTQLWKSKLAQIKKDKGSNTYDCILGLSGGVDSTYLCHLAKQNGLNPLVVHCDNGWNSELAQHNIEQTVKRCGFDLFTYVINWEEFRELQLSYLKASVVDIEVLTDHAFMAVLYEQAKKWKIKYVLAGMNIVTEQVLPNYWIYSKGDELNIKDIQKQYGTRSIKELKSFPFLNYNNKKYCDEVLKLEVVTPLNWIDYKYDEVKKLIVEELGWREYGGKHYESVWTRFYQGYILPRKFKIDKRKAHLSNLIYSGQMTKEKALEVLKTPTMAENQMRQDYDFVLKKFGLTKDEFEIILNTPRREHSEFATHKGFWSQYPYLKFLRPIYRLIKG